MEIALIEMIFKTIMVLAAGITILILLALFWLYDYLIEIRIILKNIEDSLHPNPGQRENREKRKG